MCPPAAACWLADQPFIDIDGRTRLSIRVTPAARRAGIGPIEEDADGRAFLKVAVTAAAESGKANAAVIKLLSKAWRLPKGAFELASGHKDRRKILIIDAPVATIAAKIEAGASRQ